MSQENVEIVRRFLHAFVQGDYEASTEHIRTEVVLWSDPRANMETQQDRGTGSRDRVDWAVRLLLEITGAPSLTN